ncbi:uncharacterized protein [Lepeophtheirus salmonis]|uniref:uncharacterized protein n=1 Tax=Lepeophtheirus salmonis TaxID=72036 RepID=UPI001AE70215|nr:uncharacterized protein LOC121131783 [Lepeophtheirus salmonis]
MTVDVLFAIRGLLSFISFTEFTTAGRAIFSLPGIENGGYIDSKLFSGVELSIKAEKTLGHLYGIYSILNGLIIIYSAIYSHYKPVVTLAAASLFVKILFLSTEAFIFGSIVPDQNLIFPLISSFVALGATLALPFIIGGGGEGGLFWSSEENEDILRTMKFSKGATGGHKRKIR